jgi:hypothetical protein
MKSVRRSSTVVLAALALVLAACGSSVSTLAPLITPPAASPTIAATPTPATSPAASVGQAPPAPTSFTANLQSGSVPCPSANAAGSSCSQTDLAWQSTAAAGTQFKIYLASTGEGPDTCADVQSTAVVVLQTQPDATSAQLFAEKAVGGGATCYWITAVNSAGESSQVPAAGQ